MNKKLHFLLFCLAVIVIIYLSKDKIFEPFGKLEPFGNQIVIHPDNASFEPQETTFSVLTYDSDLGSGVSQVSTCSDDSSWRMGEKTCRDYSLSGSNCEDIGSDGKSAFDACKVACDNCNTYTEVKRRLPSPIEDTGEPSYAQFEGSMSSGDIGSDIGGPDYREILGKLDDLSGKIDSIEVRSGYTVGATCVEKAVPSVQADANACAAVTELSTPEVCEAVKTAANDEIAACTYTTVAPAPAVPAVSADIQRQLSGIQTTLDGYTTENRPGISQDEIDQFTAIHDQIRDLDTRIQGIQIVDPPDMQTCDGVCEEPYLPRTFSPPNSPTFSGLSSSDKLDFCCITPDSVDVPGAHENTSLACESFNCNIPGYKKPIPPPPLEAGTEATVGNCCEADTCADDVCGTGYTAKSDQTLEAGTEATVENCCYKTGFCKENEGGKNDIPCLWPFYTDKVDSDGKPIQGQDFNSCCEYNVWWRVVAAVVLVLFLLRMAFKKYSDADPKLWFIIFIGLSLIAGLLIIFSDSIPRWIIHSNEGKWIVADSANPGHPSYVDIATAFFFISCVIAGVFTHYGKDNIGKAFIPLVALAIFILVFLAFLYFT